jgi:hypothetical protein
VCKQGVLETGSLGNNGAHDIPSDALTIVVAPHLPFAIAGITWLKLSRHVEPVSAGCSAGPLGGVAQVRGRISAKRIGCIIGSLRPVTGFRLSFGLRRRSRFSCVLTVLTVPPGLTLPIRLVF